MIDHKSNQGCNSSFSTEQSKNHSPEDDLNNLTLAANRKAFQKNLCNKFEAVYSNDLEESKSHIENCDAK